MLGEDRSTNGDPALTARPDTGLKLQFDQMSVDDLWQLREELTRVLADKLNQEKAKLELLITKLPPAEYLRPNTGRRPYPEVPRKYRNPANPTQTYPDLVWSWQAPHVGS